MHALALTDSTSRLDIIKIKEEKVEEGVEKEQDTGIVEMVKLPQDCNQGKGPGMFVSCPTASFPPTKQLPAKRLLFSVAGMSTGCFSVMATEGWFCRVAILALARCGSSLRRRTRALSPFSVAMESKVFVLNMLRASYT